MSDGRQDDGVHSTAMAEDGVSVVPPDSGGKDKAAEELEDAHEHADPSKGDKDADGDGRVKTDDQAQSVGTADEHATMFKRSI